MHENIIANEVVKKLNILIAKLYLHEAGEKALTMAEWNLVCDLGRWYENKGKLIAESRRLTQMRVVLD